MQSTVLFIGVPTKCGMGILHEVLCYVEVQKNMNCYKIKHSMPDADTRKRITIFTINYRYDMIM